MGSGYPGNGAGVTALSNGSYVVASPFWNGSKGAATWSSGSSSVTGQISSSNSLVGTTTGDQVGRLVIKLGNGNYVVASSSWSAGKGAATWGSGTTGVSGQVSSSNSLV